MERQGRPHGSHAGAAGRCRRSAGCARGEAAVQAGGSERHPSWVDGERGGVRGAVVAYVTSAAGQRHRTALGERG
jgi:hypothetical protein